VPASLPARAQKNALLAPNHAQRLGAFLLAIAHFTARRAAVPAENPVHLAEASLNRDNMLMVGRLVLKGSDVI